MIDAEFRSEERFSRLALAYDSTTEKDLVGTTVEKIIKKYTLEPEMHTTKVSNGKEVLVIEYHDDIHRECGPIFEEIMKSLDIKACS
jgi:endo-alpha-1,4-polygalactosaminidase (GH114 family)